MLSDDLDDDVVRNALYELVADITPSNSLKARISQIGKPARQRAGFLRSRSRMLAGGMASTVAVVAALVISLASTSVAPSFAVSLNPGHSVRITLYELTGIHPANARLRSLGVSARIVPMTSTCTSTIGLTYLGIAEKPAPSIRLTLPIAHGTTIILAARRLPGVKAEMAIGRTTGNPPTCASTKGLGPGIGPLKTSGAKKS